MASIRKFEDLEIWQKARELNQKIYPILLSLQETRSFELKSQLDGAAGSAMDNISEGFERDGNRKFLQFLYISKGSVGEVRSQLYRAFDRELISKEIFESLQNDCNILAAKIANFISYLQNSNYRGNKYKSRNIE
jgi:four helix bundle protein